MTYAKYLHDSANVILIIGVIIGGIFAVGGAISR